MQLAKADAELLLEVLHWNCINFENKFSLIPSVREVQQEKLGQMRNLQSRIKQGLKLS
jgi:hypothetical protein